MAMGSKPTQRRCDYVELYCKSNFSFLEGASHADELFERAKQLGYRALAITDRNSLAGIVRAHLASRDTQLPLVVGAEIHLADAWPVVVWAPDRAAYGRLARLITLGRRQAPKGSFHLTFGQLAEHAEGLLAGVVPQVPEGAWSPEDAAGYEPLRRHAELWRGRGYLVAEAHLTGYDEVHLLKLERLAERVGLPLVAAGGVLYHRPARHLLQEVLTAIRLGVPVAQLGNHRQRNAQRCLRGWEELRRRFAAVPQALFRTIEVAERCQFSLDQLRYEYPEELAPDGRSPADYLEELTWQGARQRYPDGIPAKVEQLLRHELALIHELGYEPYFLTVWDLVRFARSRGILCQGRGSAANSAVCYCLGITAVDPERSDLLFERFISRERAEAPDIDVDFEHQRREEVLQYIYEKYGRERAGMTAVVITYRMRSAIRDVGKALGIAPERIDRLAKNLERFEYEPQLADRCREVGIDPTTSLGRRLVYLVGQLVGFPRHLSQHVGGMVITQGPLCELAPIENAAMPGRTVIEWDKDDLDALGILKVDCLALGMLTAIHRCLDLIASGPGGRRLSLVDIPPEDPQVYDMICRADTMGVFQIESRAQMSMLPRLKPRSFYDLVIEVAIVRPGPIQGQMVHPYLRRRAGLEPVWYPNEAIRQVLEKTLGVPIFQEQAMRLAVVAAGFSPGEADQLRRAMGAWRRPGLIDQFRRKLIDGMLARGLSAEFAEQVFQQIRGFGEYGFPESHAASFALLVYVSAWLKYYYPVAYTAALLNSQPMGFYAPAQLIRDLQEHGGRVLPVDVNASHWDVTLETDDGDVSGTRPALRLGWRLVVGMPREAAEHLCEVRQKGGPFRSLADLRRRTGFSQAVLRRLAEADALGSLRLTRRQALWQIFAYPDTPAAEPLLFEPEPPPDDPALPEMMPFETVLADYQATNLSLKGHPVQFLRPALERLRVLSARQVMQTAHGRRVQVAGLVLLRQRPGTARGITFVTLEDETGTCNLVVHARTWQRYAQVARHSPAWLATGRVQRAGRVVHLVVEKLEDLAARLRPAQTLKQQNPTARIERNFR
ncbi:MAG: error-prone DNA polymerase [Pirellulaceae bacterium]|nr:MAG: error-prone DNA polymerase [Pirellulaceae bacterium]